MQHPRRAVWRTVAMAAATLVLVGCAPELPAPTPDQRPSLPEVVQPEVHDLEWYTDQVWNERERHERAEDIIAGCMAFNGFEYVPEVAASPPELTAAERDTEALAQAERVGYGVIAAFLESLENGGSGLYGPNAEYVEELSDEKRRAYLEALDGTQENGFEGCRSEAQLFTTSTDPGRVYQDEDLRGLVAALGDLPQLIADDERMGALEGEWSACMAEAGVLKTGLRAEMEAVFTAELEAIAEPTEAQLEALRQQEIATATADVTCAIDVQWNERAGDIEAELNADFVDEHLSDLELLVDRYGV